MAINSNYILQKYIARATLAGMILLSLTGCRSASEVQSKVIAQPKPPETRQLEAIASPSSPQSSLKPKMAVRQTTPAPETPAKIVPQNLSPQIDPEPVKTIKVNLYQPDIECKKLIPEPVAVESDRSIDAAVSKVLQARNTADFTVAGYRVSIDDDGIATVDLRLNPDSRRQFISLSMCEQFALFGSLRETLMNHPDWQIKAVQFTERGKLIQL